SISAFLLHLTSVSCFFDFFFNDPATPDIYTLSLHDALPIWRGTPSSTSARAPAGTGSTARASSPRPPSTRRAARSDRRCRSATRSEEHTSELQSRSDLVCRLLLEKKKYIQATTS